MDEMNKIHGSRFGLSPAEKQRDPSSSQSRSRRLREPPVAWLGDVKGVDIQSSLVHVVVSLSILSICGFA